MDFKTGHFIYFDFQHNTMNLMNIEKYYFLSVKFLVSLVSLESFKEFFKDDSGGLVLPFSGEAINDEDWLEYQRLEVDKNVKSVNLDDLPSDFCDEACRLVDEFHKKTVNQDVEWMLYLDYNIGEVLYCWKGEKGRAEGDFDKIHLNGRKIVSVHSHTRGFYSFPSPENFDILEHDFEDYEIITSVNAYWIVEFKGIISEISRKKFQHDFKKNMSEIMSLIRLKNDDSDIDRITEKIIGNYLLNGIDKEIHGNPLILVKKEFV